ncbi:MAG: class I SAM-dependent methyltransferase [Gammaproteobacteria bacterium]
MKFSEVRDIVKEIPFISEENAKILYDTILHQKPSDCLELGFAHGAASCYIAAALDKLGHGHLTAVDLIEAQEWQKPSIDDLLARCGLGEYVTVVREQTGYNWFLHDEIVRGSESDLCEPKYDLCVIDGSKNWTIDGLAFLLVDKLLREGGWILFDDYSWTYAAHDREATDGVTHRKLSEAERSTPHIREIFHLLVMQHPDYGNFKLDRYKNWVWAQKIRANRKEFVIEYRESYRDLIAKALFKLRAKWRA